VTVNLTTARRKNDMRYRTHRTEKLSEIGIGCYAMSGAYGTKDPGRFVDLIRRAFDLGVTFFDTADQYGPAEEILGRAVAPFRDRVWIATKVGVKADGGFDLSSGHVRSSCEGSLQRLGTDRIDLYQVHYNDAQTPVEETLGALERLKAAGKIRYYGVGHLPLPRLQAYLDGGDVFSVLLELSAVARSAQGQMLPLCREHEVGAIAFSVTGRGLLTGKIRPGHLFEEGDIRRLDPLFQRERFASGLRVAKRFKELGAKYGKAPVQVAIAWVLAQPGVVCALTGPSTLPHLEENLGGSGWSIPADDLQELQRFFRDEDRWLREEQMRSVRAILTRELDAEGGFADLVYVIETLLETGLAGEEEILPLFHRLWKWRDRRDAAALEAMRAVQEELHHGFVPILAAGELTNETSTRPIAE
jgi:aryl-alcohol dehydrogenase-like predicted oxidoreductase